MTISNKANKREGTLTKLMGVFAAVALGVGITLTGAGVASATPTEDCVPSDAWTETITVSEASWQRYSWTGGPHEPDTAPVFPGPDWQANTASDPHGVGVEGAYFRSHGGSGKGDWFYLDLVPAVTKTVEHPAVECPVEEPELTPTPTPEPEPEDSEEETGLPATGLGLLALPIGIGLLGAGLYAVRKAGASDD